MCHARDKTRPTRLWKRDEEVWEAFHQWLAQVRIILLHAVLTRGGMKVKFETNSGDSSWVLMWLFFLSILLLFFLAVSGDLKGGSKVAFRVADISGLIFICFLYKLHSRRQQRNAGLAHGWVQDPVKNGGFLASFFFFLLLLVALEIGLLFLPQTEWVIPLIWILFVPACIVNTLIASLAGWIRWAWIRTRPVTRKVGEADPWAALNEARANGQIDSEAEANLFLVRSRARTREIQRRSRMDETVDLDGD